MGYLEKMRTQPRHVKGRHAFFGAFAVTLVISGFWFLSLPAKFASVTEPKQEAVSPVRETGGFSDFIDSTRAQIGGAFGAIKKDASTESAADAVVDETEEEPVAVSEPPLLEDKHSETEAKPEGRVILIATTSSRGTESEE